MMKCIGIMTAALGCIGSVAAAEPATQPSEIEFKYNFVPGRTVQMKTVTRSVGNLKLPGPLPEQKFQQTFEQVITSRCREVRPDKSAVFDMTLSDIVMHMSMGAIAIDFDSKTWRPDPASNSPMDFVGKLFSAMNGAKFSVTASESGQPIRVEGLSESMKKAMEQLGDGRETALLRKLFDQLSATLGDEEMSHQFQSFGRLSPPKKGPVRVGDKWEHTWSMKRVPMMAGGMEGKGEYQLLGIETYRGRPCAKIRVKETFSMLPADKQPPKPAGGDAMENLLGRMKMEMSSSGGAGIAYIDYERGECLRLQQSQNIAIIMSFAADPNDPQEATRRGIPPMTQRIRTTVSMDLVEESPAGRPSKPGPKPPETAQ